MVKSIIWKVYDVLKNSTGFKFTSEQVSEKLHQRGLKKVLYTDHILLNLSKNFKNIHVIQKDKKNFYWHEQAHN